MAYNHLNCKKIFLLTPFRMIGGRKLFSKLKDRAERLHLLSGTCAVLNCIIDKLCIVRTS